MLKQHNARQVVLHAFDGSSRFIRAAVDAGYYFSVPACVTRSVPFQHLVELVPLHQLLLETDSPALAPIKGPGTMFEEESALFSCFLRKCMVCFFRPAEWAHECFVELPRDSADKVSSCGTSRLNDNSECPKALSKDCVTNQYGAM